VAGALGEVGSSLDQAILANGNDAIPVSSKAPIADATDIQGPAQVGWCLAGGSVDALLHEGGPGNHRTGKYEVQQWTNELLAICADLPAALISTPRVLEGRIKAPSESAAGRPLTTYGQVNTDQNQLWLTQSNARVLRLVNYFCSLTSATSPQISLLLWSSLLEGWRSGHITVPSTGSTTREFIDATEANHAIELLIDGSPFDRIVAAAPGLLTTSQQLGQASISVGNVAGRKDVTATFKGETFEAPWHLSSSWLARHGWSSGLTLHRMTEEISRWLVEWVSTISYNASDRG